MRAYLIIPTTIFILSSCSLGWQDIVSSPTTPSEKHEDVSVQMTATGQTREERLAESRRRQKFKSIIRKGDYFSLKNDKEVALKYYLSAYARLKDDNVMERKIAEAYLSLKDYENAYKFFQKVPFTDLDPSEQDEMLRALMFHPEITDKDSELKKFPIAPDQKAFYGYVSVCYTGIHNCVVSLEAYTGSYDRIKKLADTTRDYVKVSSDFQYRNMLLAAAFFESGQYLAGAKIAEEIVSKRPDYYVALKIAGYSYYELGNYAEANKILARYYAFDPKDVKVAYTLGLTNFYLDDYTTSNLYFNTAVLNGYSPKTELERRIVYNYYILSDSKGMFKVFRYLLEEPDVSEDDFVIAIHTAVEAKEVSKGIIWANKGLAKFPESDTVYALRANIHLTRNDPDAAKTDIDRALAINPKSTIALLYRAKLHFAKNEYTEAKQDASAVVDTDKGGSFAEEADAILSDIAKQESLSSSGVTVETR